MGDAAGPIVDERVVALEAVHNFRDLGGYPTVDGRATRWRRLFRADGLYRLTAADVETLRPLGLRSVIDLRTPGELDERGRFPVDAHPVTFHHVPIIDILWGDEEPPDESVPVADYLFGKYVEMVERAEDRFAQAFLALAAEEALPAVFHCAAGKDRTGVFAALILSTLGVPDEHVVADYALTGEAMARMKVWFEAAEPEMAVRFASTPAAYVAADPDAMRRLLVVLREQHGSVRSFVQAIGVPDEALHRLEHLLLTP